MAKIHLDRMRKKYGFTGGNLGQLMQEIMAVNSENLSRAMARISKQRYQKSLGRVTTKTRQFVIPDVSEVIPKRSVFIRKGAESGKRLTDDLRDRLTKNLRQTMTQFTPKTGEQTFLFRRGPRRGRVNPRLVQDFERQITGTFTTYTKKDPSYGVPKNVQAIAVTEVRSVADEVKWNYAQNLAKANRDIDVSKRWIHNKALSEEPREHHMIIDGQRRSLAVDFTLGNGVKLRFPHDPQAPVGEVISCHCDMDILVTVLREL